MEVSGRRLPVHDTPDVVEMRAGVPVPAQGVEGGEGEPASRLEETAHRREEPEVLLFPTQDTERGFAEADGGVEGSLFTELLGQVRQVQVQELYLHTGFRSPLPRRLEQSGRDIHANRAVAAARQLNGMPSGATSQVHHLGVQRQLELALEEAHFLTGAGQEPLVNV